MSKKLVPMEAMIANLPPREERLFTIKLSDHRGRIFTERFFVAGEDGAGGLFVWGVSRSSATKVVSMPSKGKKRYGKRCGWGLKKAEAVAALFSAASAAAAPNAIPAVSARREADQRQPLPCCLD